MLPSSSSVTDSPDLWSVFAEVIDNSHVDFAHLTISGCCHFVAVTEYRKLGTIVQIVRDNQHSIAPCRDIFTTRVLLGDDTDSVHAAARYIAARVPFGRQLLVSLAVRDLGAHQVRRIANCLVKNIGSSKNGHRRPRYGQVVVGPPGSGKTTYCRAMQEFLRSQRRPTLVVNLDPANDLISFQPDIDVSALITVSEVMQTHTLGPNGALIYSMQFIAENFHLIIAELDKYPEHYVLFDFPGQVELYTHDRSVPEIVKQLELRDFRLVAVNLVDAHHCSDPGKFISMVLTCLSAMLHLALPHINVLSKLDTAERHQCLLFGLDFYTEVLDLDRLVQAMEEYSFMTRHRRLSAALAGVIERYSLVSFQPLAVNDQRLLSQLIHRVDTAGGFVFGRTSAGDSTRSIQSMLACAVGAQSEHDRVAHTADEYLDGD